MKNYNPQKKLIPFGESGHLFENENPIPTWINCKGYPAGYDYFYFDDMPIMKQSHKIYWFWIGNRELDIRDFREKAGFYNPIIYLKDVNKPGGYYKKQLTLIATQIDIVAKEFPIYEFLEDILWTTDKIGKLYEHQVKNLLNNIL